MKNRWTGPNGISAFLQSDSRVASESVANFSFRRGISQGRSMVRLELVARRGASRSSCKPKAIQNLFHCVSLVMPMNI